MRQQEFERHRLRRPTMTTVGAFSFQLAFGTRNEAVPLTSAGVEIFHDAENYQLEPADSQRN